MVFYFLLITNPILLTEKSWVAFSSFIGIDVTIGKGSVLNQYHKYKHVEKWTLVGGNPAKFLKKRVLNE